MEETVTSVRDMSISCSASEDGSSGIGGDISSTNNAGSGDIFVYDIPFDERKRLCRVLDCNEEWKDLGGRHMRFRVDEILEIESRARRSNSSPTDLLLSEWGERNHKLLELFVLLVQYDHYPALECIKNLVNPQYRKLVDSVRENYSHRMSCSTGNITSAIHTNSSNAVPLPVKYIEQGKKPESSKILNGPSYEVSDTCNVTSSVETSVSASEKIAESAGALLKIPYAELQAATNNWDSSNILGKGGFGVVYRGDWKHTAVAIKRLKSTAHGGGVSDESLRELKYLNACRHDNVLPLYGYSMGGGESCLVYQLMGGGSLEERLKCRNGRAPLKWSFRVKIAQGVAKGLQYLHTVSGTPLIHGDIKSANILLDTCDEPRIGDFGLAREGPHMDVSHLQVTRVHGTRPYLPDEFLRGKKLSTKVDTYSFGVVMFELVAALPAYDDRRKLRFLKDHVLEYCTQNPTDLSGIQDVRLIEAGDSNPELCHRFVVVGIKCVQNRASDRPDMVDVWKELMTIPVTEFKVLS